MSDMLLTAYNGAILGPIAKVLGWVMNGIYALMSMIGIENVGLSIIIFTIVIYAILFPLTYKQQGGDMSSDASMELYAVTADGGQTAPFMLTTYNDWQNPTIKEIKVTDGTVKIGVRFQCNVGSWGTVDDFTLNRISD